MNLHQFLSGLNCSCQKRGNFFFLFSFSGLLLSAIYPNVCPSVYLLFLSMPFFFSLWMSDPAPALHVVVAAPLGLPSLPPQWVKGRMSERGREKNNNPQLLHERGHWVSLRWVKTNQEAIMLAIWGCCIIKQQLATSRQTALRNPTEKKK